MRRATVQPRDGDTLCRFYKFLGRNRQKVKVGRRTRTPILPPWFRKVGASERHGQPAVLLVLETATESMCH